MRGPWMRLSVDMFTDDKIGQLSHERQLLFIKLVAWSVKHGTDGRIPWAALQIIGSGHRRVTEAIDQMWAVGLLDRSPIEHGLINDTTPIEHALHIHSFASWQMASGDRSHKSAGRSVGESSGLVRAGACAGTENRTEETKSLNRERTRENPAHVGEGLVAVIDGMKLEHDGSGWVEHE